MPIQRKQLPTNEQPFEVPQTNLHGKDNHKQAESSGLLSGWTMTPLVIPAQSDTAPQDGPPGDSQPSEPQ